MSDTDYDFDETLGLYAKYEVRRRDGSSDEGGKHEKCDYFVLDWEHDPCAIPALREYARCAYSLGYKSLARDLILKLSEREKRRAFNFDLEHLK